MLRTKKIGCEGFFVGPYILCMKLKLQVHLPETLTKWFPEAIWRMDETEKSCYLTFDDGPIPEITPWVLDLLAQYNIKATFFVVGENVHKYPEIYHRIIEEGHAVGNHTYNHLQGLKTPNKEFYQNIEKTDRLIGSNLFRPPHGLVKRSQYRYLKQKYKLIMWDVISCDYNRNISKMEVLRNVLDFVRPGSIITFHDSIKSEENLKYALPLAIQALQGEGYEFKKIEFPKIRPLYIKPNIEIVERIREKIRRISKGA